VLATATWLKLPYFLQGGLLNFSGFNAYSKDQLKELENEISLEVKEKKRSKDAKNLIIHGTEDEFINIHLAKQTYNRLKEDHGFQNLNINVIEGAKHKLNREMITFAKEFMDQVRSY